MKSKKLGGDLTEVGKKRNTDYDFPPPLMWAENNSHFCPLSENAQNQRVIIDASHCVRGT